MIDLHSHMIAGYDDGATDEDETFAMARLYAADGVETVAATPHAGAWFWGPPPDDLPERCEALNAKLASLAIPLTVVPGAEIYLTPDTLEWLGQRRGGLRSLADSRSILLEFSLGGPERGVEEGILRLQDAGWRVVLAHGERYASLQRRPESLAVLIERGVLVQVNGGSLLGEFGGAACELGEHLIRSDLAALVATDAHRAHHRRPRLADARRRIVALAGESAAERLTRDNPARILADGEIRVQGDAAALRGGQQSLWRAVGL